GDSNPRYAIHVYTLSRRAPSTTRPPVLSAFLNEKRSPLFYQIRAYPVFKRFARPRSRLQPWRSNLRFRRYHTLDVTCDHVDLQIHGDAGFQVLQRGHFHGVRYEIDADQATVIAICDLIDGKA